MTSSPIFIVGTERSGSNLLRVILNCHPSVTIPHPPHVLRYFRPLEKGYGDLSKEESFRRLASDVARLIRWHINTWDVVPDVEKAVAEAPRRNSFGLYAAFMEQARVGAGGARWGCKSTFMVNEIGAILDVFPAAKLIFLVRDPRDVAVSARASVFSAFHPWHTACLWRDEQNAGIAWLDRLPPERMLHLPYEALLAAPEEKMRRVCDFIEEPFVPEMLRFFESKEAKRGAALSESWKTTAEPIRTDRIGRFKKSLPPEEILLVEAVCRVPMRRLGYETLHDDGALDAALPDEATRRRYDAEARKERLRVELRSLRNDKNFAVRMRRDVLVGWLRWRHGG